MFHNIFNLTDVLQRNNAMLCNDMPIIIIKRHNCCTNAISIYVDDNYLLFYRFVIRNHCL